MDKKRAVEIANSSVMANVKFNGRQIYIQHVDETLEQAGIYHLDEPENEQTVSLGDLVEYDQ